MYMVTSSGEVASLQAVLHGYTDIHSVYISDKNGNNFWAGVLCCDDYHKG